MPIYSFISLMLGLFGATYTAIIALKNYFDKYVDSVGAEADGWVRDLESLNRKETHKHAEHLRRRIRIYRVAWKWSHLLPIIGFWCFAFGFAAWALVHWDGLAEKTIPGWGWWVLLSCALVNFGSSIISGFSLCRVWRNNVRLKTHWGFATENTYGAVISPVPTPPLRQPAIGPVAPVLERTAPSVPVTSGNGPPAEVASK